MKSYHSFLYTELHLMLLKKKKNVYQTLILHTETETASGQQNVLMWEWLVNTLQKLRAHNIALV